MPAIEFTLVTPGKKLFAGNVSWVQVPARDGYMGFLPGHAPLVSLAGTGMITCRMEGGKEKIFTMSGGYFEIHLNRMTVMADVAEHVESIDLERAEKARQRALDRIRGTLPGDWDIDRAHAALLRALNRIGACQNCGILPGRKN
ncbi:ATP synthase F1 subunit epsilon [bacterium]|nr:ATP synthase F1 subunit epsilon [candidate division CSSED10-310 bacterium]